MKEKNKPYISEEQVSKLANQIKKEMKSLKGKIFLGVFNNKIPILLRSERKFPFELKKKTFRIHYKEPDGEWWILVNDGEEALFTFYIPEELKKLASDNPSSNHFVELKCKHMSSLTFTYKVENRAFTEKLILDLKWIEEIRKLKGVFA